MQLKYFHIFFLHLICLISSQTLNRPKIEISTQTHNARDIFHKFNPNKISRRQRNVLNNFYVSKVYTDSEMGNYYYTTLYIGSNKSPQTYILDTGSSIMTSPCTSCTKCGRHTNPYYDAGSSSNILARSSKKCGYLSNNKVLRVGNNNNDCWFNTVYSEGSSISGYYTMRTVYFHNLLNEQKNFISRPFKIPIGCTTEEKNVFFNQKADGIMGLNNNEKSFMNMLYQTDTIRLNLFTLCFSDKGGYFALGRVDRTYHKSRVIRFVPIIKNINNYYNIRINQIHINTFPIHNRFFATIDTGNTITYFPQKIYNEILTNFNIYCHSKNKTCGTFSNVEKYGYCATFNSKTDLLNALDSWPNITLILEGFSYNWLPIDYYYEYKSNEQLHACLGFNIDTVSKITLGANFIHNYDVIFDRYHQKIGFVRSDCSRTNKTYIFADLPYAYDFQRPKPINLKNKAEEDEETILDEFDDGRKKSASIWEYILSGLVIFGVIVIIIVVLCKSSKNISWYKKNVLSELDVESSSLQKERDELMEYQNSKKTQSKRY